MGKVGCWLSAKVGVGGHPEAQPAVGSTGIPVKQVVGRKQERREAKALPLNTLRARRQETAVRQELKHPSRSCAHTWLSVDLH